MQNKFFFGLCIITAAFSLDAKDDFKHSEKFLKKTLANHAVLLHQTLNYHWNVEGKEFHDYHLLFDKMYNDLFKDLDLIAERIRAVGGKALGSMKHLIEAASIKEDNGETPKPKEMIEKLHDQYHKVIEDIRTSTKKLEKSSDVATRKLFEDQIEKLEKTKWMLKSLLKK